TEATEGAPDKPRRSPLLPIRHQPDFFVCDIVDAAFKADQGSMEHPIFTLSKKPEHVTRRYENGDKWLEVRPSYLGTATVFDRDIIIYCLSQLIAGLNEGRTIGKTLHMQARDILIATNRQLGGRGYDLLQQAFQRLQGTQIVTN